LTCFNDIVHALSRSVVHRFKYFALSSLAPSFRCSQSFWNRWQGKSAPDGDDDDLDRHIEKMCGLSAGSLALPGGGALLCGSRSRSGGTLRGGSTAELSALSGRGTIGRFAAAVAALLAAPCRLIHCGPGAALRFTSRHTPIFVALFDMLGLTLLLVCVR
jgi:hypothetical protein